MLPVHRWTSEIGAVGAVEPGCPNAASVVNSQRLFSVFHLPDRITPEGVQDYLRRQEAAGARVEMVEMSMDDLEARVRVSSKAKMMLLRGLPRWAGTGSEFQEAGTDAGPS
jgi:hypothetical protein